jgi:hypothetical protein
MWTEQVKRNFNYHLVKCLEGLSKIMKTSASSEFEIDASRIQAKCVSA